jgi:thiamine transport system substrate-binding protein
MIVALLSAPVWAQDNVLTVVTYDSFSLSEGVLAQFEEETGIRVEILRLADAGAMVNQAILTRDFPLGDVLYGIDNTFLTRGLDGEIFEAYESPGLVDVPEAFVLDDEFRVTPVAYGDVCLNYDRAYFEANALELPESLEDLTAPEYAGLLVVPSAATSSPGLAFLLTTIAAFGEDGDYTYLDYWSDLVANDVLVVDGWSQAYYGAFSVAGEGDRPLVLSYASSPPAEVYFAAEPVEEGPTGAIVADGMCFRQVEFVGILQGTDAPEAARQFIDFALSLPFQEDLPLQMFVYPVNENAELPEVFVEHSAVPENPVTVDIEAIEESRETWIRNWTQTVLR